MATKTNKKNDTTIEWPTTHFTIIELWDRLKAEATARGEQVIPCITLRFNINKALDKKELVTLGKVRPAIGRPRLVFARANPTDTLLTAARAAGVMVADDNPTLTTVTVAKVKTEKKSKTVIPVVSATDTQATPVIDPAASVTSR
jgi:hypothetical protein